MIIIILTNFILRLFIRLLYLDFQLDLLILHLQIQQTMHNLHLSNLRDLHLPHLRIRHCHLFLIHKLFNFKQLQSNLHISYFINQYHFNRYNYMPH